MRTGRVAAITASLVILVACGGGDDDADDLGAGGSTTTIDGSDGGGGGGSPEADGGQFRFVNLLRVDGEPSTIDVYPDSIVDEQDEAVVEDLQYGEVSPYVRVPEELFYKVFLHGSIEDDALVLTDSETVQADARATVVIATGDPDAMAAVPSLFQTFFETGVEHSSLEPPGSGDAMVYGNASPLEHAVPDSDAISDGMILGIPGNGCLTHPGDDESTRTLVGGTQLVSYPVEPGSIEVALYALDNTSCSGEPLIGPASVDSEDGSRIYVFAYGAPGELQLLVLDAGVDETASARTTTTLSPDATSEVTAVPN